jgi:hypothetical protein
LDKQRLVSLLFQKCRGDFEQHLERFVYLFNRNYLLGISEVTSGNFPWDFPVWAILLAQKIVLI